MNLFDKLRNSEGDTKIGLGKSTLDLGLSMVDPAGELLSRVKNTTIAMQDRINSLQHPQNVLGLASDLLSPFKVKPVIPNLIPSELIDLTNTLKDKVRFSLSDLQSVNTRKLNNPPEKEWIAKSESQVDGKVIDWHAPDNGGLQYEINTKGQIIADDLDSILNKAHRGSQDIRGVILEELPFRDKLFSNPNDTKNKGLLSLTLRNTALWGVQLTNVLEPNDLSLRSSKVPIPQQPCNPEGNKACIYNLGGWMPCTSLEMPYRTMKFYDYALPGGYSLEIPLRPQASFDITTSVPETDEMIWDNYLKQYYRAMFQGNKTAPYKNCVSMMTIYFHRVTGKTLYKQSFYVIPDISFTYSGSSSSGTKDISIKWNVVAEGELEAGTVILNVNAHKNDHTYQSTI